MNALKIGDRCHLRHVPTRVYRVAGVIQANKTHGQMLILITPEGGRASWYTKQLIKIT